MEQEHQFRFHQCIALTFGVSYVRISRRDTLHNSISYSELRNDLLKNIKEILEVSQDYGGLVRNHDVYPINMDVYNPSSTQSDFKSKYKKSLCILKSLTGKTVPMNVINIDMVDSSERVKSLQSKKVELYYKTFIEKTAELIQQFGGYVLKNVGDCVIGFFLSGDNINENYDTVVSCGLSEIDMIKNMNKDFEEKGLPHLNCRVSADYGEAQVVQIQSHGDYSTLDLFGNALNKPTKILHYAKPDQMVIGGDLYASFNDDFREGIKKKFIQISSNEYGFDFKLIRHFDIKGNENYPVFVVNKM